MIEDKKLGLKIAENSEEALWEKVRRAREASIKEAEEAIKIEKVFLKAAEKELKRIQKNKKPMLGVG